MNRTRSQEASHHLMLLDTAVKFRRENLTEIDVPRQFKAVTVGQAAAADAHIYNFTFRGNSLKPLSVAHLRGARSAANDLLIEWTRRSRLAQGIRDYADAPLAEEDEVYQLEVWNGETLLRRVRITGGVESEAITWEVTMAAQGA